MKQSMVYVAILRKDIDSDWGVEFPDVPGCFSAGRTVEDALTGAREALQGHIDTLNDLGELIPEAKTDAASLNLKPTDGECVTISLVEVSPPSRTIRVNITLQDRLWARAGELAKARGTTRSGIIAQLVESAKF